MNYLAHFHLAGEDPELLAGSLLGEFLRGPVPGDWSPGVRLGVRLHRQVDAFTDAHPVTARSRGRFQPPLRRYAGILIDLFYDHCLARDWSDHSPVPLAEFARAVYARLHARRAEWPPPMQRGIDYMIAHDLLCSYRELEGIGRALRGISGRLRRANPLADALPELERHADGLAEDFAAFFPDVVVHAARIRGGAG
ncbi:MAG: ACP phosphodiesterase [Candidatus Competibacter sp.]|nr:ACP phosphodiesterase [Candidatus Competibacter sp.]